MIDVTCAIIVKDNKILATRRARGFHLEGYWEFPGGKIESGESAENCIIREIFEELNVVIEIVKPLIPVEHHYPEKSIRLIPFLSKITFGSIRLTDHSEFRWVDRQGVETLNWAAADREIILKNKANWQEWFV